MRVVEWDVSQSPSGPTGDLRSLKLRALTPDGIRIAIAKEYGLSNYREVHPILYPQLVLGKTLCALRGTFYVFCPLCLMDLD